MKKIVIAVIVVLAAAAAVFGLEFRSSQSTVVHGGVAGTVTLGPVCPVERVPSEPQCAPKPYKTSVVVYKASGGGRSVYETINTGDGGSFMVNLPPGDYVLLPQSGNPFPRCSEADITVPADQFVSADLSCDTGIR